MEFGLDVSTLIVAVIAGIWTYLTWNANRVAQSKAAEAEAARVLAEAAVDEERALAAAARDEAQHERELERQERAKEREARRDELDDREYRSRDIAEAHAIHKELTSRDIFVSLQEPRTEPHLSYLTELHRRLSTRANVLYRTDGQNEGPAAGTEGFEAFATMIYDRLDVLKAATKNPGDGDAMAEKAARDFTKYTWDGSSTRHGKGGILSFIGARFAKLENITSVEEFSTRFGDVVRDVLNDEVRTKPFDDALLLDPLLFDGQRDRYATTNRRWRDAYGSDGVLTFDGTDYRTAWSLGFKGVGIAPLQKKLIEHFAQHRDYPIVELDTV